MSSAFCQTPSRPYTQKKLDYAEKQSEKEVCECHKNRCFPENETKISCKNWRERANPWPKSEIKPRIASTTSPMADLVSNLGFYKVVNRIRASIRTINYFRGWGSYTF